MSTELPIQRLLPSRSHTNVTLHQLGQILNGLESTIGAIVVMSSLLINTKSIIFQTIELHHVGPS